MYDFFEAGNLESFLSYWCLHIAYAPYLLFGLIVLSGFNIPVGEEPLVVFGGVLAAHCAPQDTLWIWGWIYVGTILSAYITYWIGRCFGPQVQRFVLFRQLVDPDSIAKMGERIQKYGLLTFVVGRFAPGGMRNALFFTSGWTHLPFKIFMFRDGIGAFISSAALFILGMQFSEHAALLFQNVKFAEHWLGVVLLLVLLSCVGAWTWHRWVRKV